MHAFLDKYSVAVTRLLLKDRWFNDSVESVGYQKQLETLSLALPEFNGEGFFEVKTHSSVGDLDPAFQVVKWMGSNYPTIIYHHGNNETPFKYGAASKNTFKSVLYGEKESIDANLITLRAAFHNDGIKAYTGKMDRLENFTAMLATSVKLVESLTCSLKEKGCKRIIVTGLSLGGWVANLHRSFYNSAHIYMPVFAGAALDELFISSYYEKLVGEAARHNPEVLKKTLNFTKEFQQVREDNVFPLLARFDQFIEYDIQKLCYEERPIKVIEKGHITGALSSSEIREHILTKLT